MPETARPSVPTPPTAPPPATDTPANAAPSSFGVSRWARRHWWVWLIVAAIAAFLVVPALTPDKVTMNSGGVEQQVSTGIQDQVGMHVAVNCPDNPTLTVGDTMKCHARNANGGAVVVVKLVDSDGHFTWSVPAMVNLLQ